MKLIGDSSKKMMINPATYTLISPQNGNLAFKISCFENNSNYDHIQRLNYYSLILITEGSAILKADFAEHEVKKNYLLSFSPYQPFMLGGGPELRGITINFH